MKPKIDIIKSKYELDNILGIKNKIIIVVSIAIIFIEMTNSDFE
tara:strand:+ start:284 stop:415 length:132 start_codon:yes stop_codon:yes gene_type:complete